ncbi:MAG: amino acid dehydrogenase [Yangia sp.]|nr:amino acid dehydrogenase [Salipiger sp.]
MHIEKITTGTHEEVLFCTDERSGLRAIIAVHDTTLGPALGGCRYWRYDGVEDALADAMRLSAGMTAKAALAGVPFGGGKAVIMADPQHEKTPAMMRAFGRFIETLNGRYITGEDVGVSPADMAHVAEETAHVAGLTTGRFASGDPSPITAEGVFRCMKLAAAQVFGSDSLRGRIVALQGLGHVGLSLAGKMRADGAQVVAADMNPKAVEAARDLGVQIVAPDRILTQEADILAPCALGSVIDHDSIAGLKVRMICGAANNQLATPDCAQELHRRGILYCPDYVVNAGGLINIAREALQIGDADWASDKLEAAVANFGELIAWAAKDRRPPLEEADAMVQKILQDGWRQSHAM